MTEQLFFDLIRVTIGNQICLSHSPTADEWGKLYDMAKKQSLVGVCFAGVQKLVTKKQEPPEMLYLTWMGMAAKIQQRNEVVDRQCAELQAKLSADGLRSCVLKGQGVGFLYGESLCGLRQSGDIDAWVDGGFDVVNAFVQKTAPTDDVAYHRFHFDAFEDTEVELHHRPTLMRNLLDDRKLEKWYKSHDFSTFENLDKGFCVPSLEFNRVFILTHIYRHFLFEGVGLRQVLDYYFVLRSQQLTAEEKSKTMAVLRSFKMSRFASAVMWVLSSSFGLDRRYLLCEPDEEEGKFLLSEILLTGNFGHAETRYKGNSKIRRMTRHWLHLLSHYPSEVIWSPIWIMYHHIWRWNKKRQIMKMWK